MPTLLEKDVKAVSIEYLPTEEEMDRTKPLVVGKGLTDRFRIVEPLTSKMHFGVKRYVTGIDPEVIKYDSTLSEQEKKDKLLAIEIALNRLQDIFGADTLKATNDAFWSKVFLDISRKTINLDLTVPENEILFHCIKAGGFNTVAPSLEYAEANGTKFYLVEPIEFVENRVAPRKIVTKAKALLYEINEKKPFDDLFFLAKYIMPVEKAYTKHTPKSLIFEDIDKFIDGEVIRKPKAECARQLIDATKRSKSNLIVTCMIRDAVYYNFLYMNPAGEFKNNETAGVYGTTVEKCVEHLLSPAYQHELDNLRDRIERKWLE